MQLAEKKSLFVSLVDESVAYWHCYLWHHRHPRTRLLHRIGSYVSLIGLCLLLAGQGWYFAPLGIAIGYMFAFAGHYIVEKNRPLTFKDPIRAGICNWVLFFYEIFFDVEAKLRTLESLKLNTDQMSSI